MHESNKLILEAFPIALERMGMRFTVEGLSLHQEEIIDPQGVFLLFMGAALDIENKLRTDFLRSVKIQEDQQSLMGYRVDLSAPVNPIILGLYLMHGAYLMTEVPLAAQKEGALTVVDLSKVTEAVMFDALFAWQMSRERDVSHRDQVYDGLTRLMRRDSVKGM